MILQEIVSEIIKQVETKLSDRFKEPVKGYGIAIKTPNGEVVSAEVTGSERKRITIEDNKGTYFYIRLLGKVQSRRLNRGEKLGACTEMQGTANMRLVIVRKCSNPQILLLLAQNALFGVGFNQVYWAGGQVKAELFDKASDFNPWDIFGEETGKPKTDFTSSAIQLASIDFDIRFNTNYDYCSIDICK